MADKLNKADVEAIEAIAIKLKPLLDGITLQIQAQTTALKAQGTQFDSNKQAVNDFLTAIKEGKATQEALTSAVEKAITPYLNVATAQDKVNLKIKTAKAAFTEIVDLLKEQGKLDDAAAKKLTERVKNLRVATEQEKAAANIRSTAGLEKKAAGTQTVQFARAGTIISQQTSKAATGAAPGGDATTVQALLHLAKKLGVDKLIGGAAAVAGGGTSEFISGVKATNLEVNALAAGFAKLTGQVMMTDFAVQRGDESVHTFAQRLIEIQHIAKDLGIEIKEVAKTFETLMLKSRQFGTMTRTGTNLEMRQQAVELARLAVEFSAVGIKGDNFATIIENLGKTFKVTNIVGETKSWAVRLTNLARITGQTTDVVAKDFGVAIEHLAAYRLPNAQNAFEKLSIISATTGVSMEKLLKTASGFDDMEKAASSVGDLNAMLGGPYLNTLDMVNATEGERIEKLQEGMIASGKSWQTMDRFMRKAIAKAAGMSVVDASRIFGHEDVAAGHKATREELSTTMNLQKEQLDMMANPDNIVSYKRLIETQADGARRHAVALEQRLKAVKQSMTVEEAAYQKMEAMGVKAMNAISEVGDKVRDYVSKQAVGALEAISGSIDEIVRKITAEDFTGALADLMMIPAKLLETVITGGGSEVGRERPKTGLRRPTPAPSTSAGATDVIDVRVVNQEVASGGSPGGEPGGTTAAPSGVFMAGAGQEFALTQNIVLKIDGEVLHQQVTKSLEKILPGMWRA